MSSGGADGSEQPALAAHEESHEELFVPGRVCIVGEHSDWAATHRTVNPDIAAGQCIVYGTSCGLYASASRAPTSGGDPRRANHFSYCSSVVPAAASSKGDGGSIEEQRWIHVPWEIEALTAEAREGGFFAYVCGTAAEVLSRYTTTRVGPIVINNYKCDMPVRKGLSSSAAVCVLVASAFNAVFALRLTVEDIMDIAYHGELRTPSRCGRMDQCCAFGRTAVLVHFDGDQMRAEPLTIGGTFYFVVADLGRGKDTARILAALQAAYPHPQTPIEEAVHRFLGHLNRAQVAAVVAALRTGDAVALGESLNETQRLFDAHLQPQCPDQLTAPRLHEVLDDPQVKALSLGGKGVGSQGDGSVQFVCRSATEQQGLIERLQALGCLHVEAMNLEPTLPKVPHADDQPTSRAA